MNNAQRTNGKSFDLRDFEAEVIESLTEIDKSHLMPCEKAMRRLFDLYGKVYPREKACYSCRGVRAQVYKYFKKQVEQWTSK